jgi:hypothetical protein
MVLVLKSAGGKHSGDMEPLPIMVFFLKTYQTPFAHLFHFLGPASTGNRNPGIGLFSSICPWSCFALFDDYLSIDLNCIKVFPIIMMFP